MIKLFRNFRKNLLNEGKTTNPSFAKASAGTYFKYAFGEIILVVIGILIAENLAPPDSYRDLKPACRTGRGGFSGFEL